jgi:hypothetical protein
MGSNGFVITLLWLSWVTYTVLILKSTIPELNVDQELYLCLLGLVYGLVLIGWILMNPTTAGKNSFPVSQAVMDISITLCAVITCSSWAYFS